MNAYKKIYLYQIHGFIDLVMQNFKLLNRAIPQSNQVQQQIKIHKHHVYINMYIKHYFKIYLIQDNIL